MCQYFRSKVTDSSSLAANYKDQVLKRSRSSLQDVSQQQPDKSPPGKKQSASNNGEHGITDLCTPPASDCSDDEVGHAKRRKLTGPAGNEIKSAPPLFQSRARFSNRCLWQPIGMPNLPYTSQGIGKLSPPCSEDLGTSDGSTSSKSPPSTSGDDKQSESSGSSTPKRKLSVEASSVLDLSVKPDSESADMEKEEDHQQRSKITDFSAGSILNLPPSLPKVSLRIQLDVFF